MNELLTAEWLMGRYPQISKNTAQLYLYWLHKQTIYYVCCYGDGVELRQMFIDYLKESLQIQK